MAVQLGGGVRCMRGTYRVGVELAETHRAGCVSVRREGGGVGGKKGLFGEGRGELSRSSSAVELGESNSATDRARQRRASSSSEPALAQTSCEPRRQRRHAASTAHCRAPACAMESPLLRTGFRRAIASTHASSQRQALACQRRWLATPTESSGREPVRAAQPIQFTRDDNQFAHKKPAGGFSRGGPPRGDGPKSDILLSRIRILPASPSYFTATPRYTDDLLALSALLRKYQLLPQCPPGEAPRIAWKTWEQYKSEVDEPVKETRYNRLLEIIKRLNYIHPALMPEEVTTALERFKRILQPFLNKPKPIIVDNYGRARASGRRKSSTASVYVVEGTGEAVVNGKSLTEYFGRLHDRESAVWALKQTERLDRYNVWATTSGGGTTGQAESIMLATAKALMAHEPDLRPILKRGEFCPRNVHCLISIELTQQSQREPLRATPSVSRERRPASSRLARCLPGSSVKARFQRQSIVLLCTEPVLHTLTDF